MLTDYIIQGQVILWSWVSSMNKMGGMALCTAQSTFTLSSSWLVRN